MTRKGRVYPQGAMLGIHREAQKRQAILRQRAILNMKVSFADALKGVSSAVIVQLTDWAQRFVAVTDNHHPEILSANLQTLGRAAQLDMLQMYEELVVREEGPASRTHYRAGVGRLAGGILMEALGRKDFFTVTGNKLAWGNIDMLDASAHHWGRIAFGAGAEGGGIADREDVSFRGMALTSIGIEGKPSAPFSMPRGIWLKPGSQTPGKGPRGADEFYPENTSRPTLLETAPGIKEERPNLGRADLLGDRNPDRRSSAVRGTRGIRTHDFFKAGLETMANPDEGLPKILTNYLFDLTHDWEQQVSQRRVVDVNIRSRVVR
jgi:hypothetical protein